MVNRMRNQWRDQNESEDETAQHAPVIECTDPSLVQEHYAEDADINNIVRLYGIKDGAVPPAAMDPKYFGDFSDGIDLMTAMNNVREAKERFEALPADIRKRFRHDPAELYDFVSNPDNAEESVRLGLLSKAAPFVDNAKAGSEPPAPPAKTPEQ